MNEINRDSELEAGSDKRPSVIELVVLGAVVLPALFCSTWIFGDVLSHAARAALPVTAFDWLSDVVSFAAWLVGVLVGGLVIIGPYSLVQAIARRLRPGTTVADWLEAQDDAELDAEAYYRQETPGFSTFIVRVFVWLALFAGSYLLISNLTGTSIMPTLLLSGTFEAWAIYATSVVVAMCQVYVSLVIATGGAILTAAIQKRVKVRKSANEAS
ncbi:MAG: hypothetical protein WED09_05450 [Homoserinimonas sp.]